MFLSVPYLHSFVPTFILSSLIHSIIHTNFTHSLLIRHSVTHTHTHDTQIHFLLCRSINFLTIKTYFKACYTQNALLSSPKLDCRDAISKHPKLWILSSRQNYPYQTNIHPVVIFKASESQRTNLRYQMGPHLVAIMAAKWPESQAHLAANCLFKRVYRCLPHCWRRLLPRGLDVHVLALWFSLPSSPPYQHQGACCCGYVCPSVVPPMGRTLCYSAHWQYCYPRGY